MSETNATDDMNKALFSSLLMMLGSSAMQQLGLLPNPVTNETEKVNLEGARISIDMLEMLSIRTAGNLDADEQKMLGDMLSSLQMSYVQASRPAGDEPESPAPDTDAQEAASEAPPPDDKPAPEEPPETGDDQAGPKYHKSYGS